MGVTTTFAQPKDYGKKLVEMFPMYLALGMSYEEYWNGDNYLPKAYLQAEEIKDAKMNQWLWLQGRYVYDAIGSLIPAFKFGVKHPKAEPYVERPYPLTAKEAEEIRENKYRAMLSKMKVKAEESKHGRD